MKRTLLILFAFASLQSYAQSNVPLKKQNGKTVEQGTNITIPSIRLLQSDGTLPSSRVPGLSTSLSNKQNVLQSGVNIKTINGSPVLGSGDISISGSGTIDPTPVSGSNNAVSSGGVYSAIANSSSSTTPAESAMADIRDFGAIPNDNLDDSKAINAAILFAMSNPARKSSYVLIPEGTWYQDSVTIHLGYGNAALGNNGYANVVLHGVGASYDPNFTGSRLICRFDDKPGINFQGLRDGGVEDIYYRGMNTIPEGYFGDNELMYRKQAFDANDIYGLQSDSSITMGRYRGNFAITIGAYGSVPSTVGRFTNAPYGYGMAPNSKFFIRNCVITQWVAGIVIDPSGTDGNNDFGDIRNNIISRCKWSVSSGATQNRMNDITSCQLDGGYELITTSRHGKQQGRINSVTYTHVQGNTMFFILDMATNGPIGIAYVYGEQINSLGFIGVPATSAGTANFTSCNFYFNHEIYGNVPTKIFSSYKASFTNCILSGLTLNMEIAHSSGEIVMRSTDINIYASNQYNSVLNWYSGNQAIVDIFDRKYLNHPIHIFGAGKLIIEPGCKVVLDRHPNGGIDYKFYDVIGSNTYRYVQSRSTPGTTGIMGDYLYRSKSLGLSEISNRTFTGLKFTGTINNFGTALATSLAQPGDVLDFKAYQAEVMITKRGTADGLASANAIEGVLMNGFNYDNNGFVSYKFNAAELTSASGQGDFFWWNNSWYDNDPYYFRSLALVGSLSGNVVSNVVYAHQADDNNTTPGIRFKNGSIIQYYTYSGSPDVRTSIMGSAKVLSTSAATVTLEASTMTNGLSGQVLIFNRYPYQIK